MTWIYVYDPHEGYKLTEEDDSDDPHSYHNPPSPNPHSYYELDNNDERNYNQRGRNRQNQNHPRHPNQHRQSYSPRPASFQRCYQQSTNYSYGNDLEYESDGTEMSSFVSYQEDEDYHHQEHFQSSYEDHEEHNHEELNNKLDALMMMMEEHQRKRKEYMESEERSNAARDKIISQLFEDVKQLQQEWEQLANDVVVGDEAIDLADNEVEELVVENNTIPTLSVAEEPMPAVVSGEDDDAEGEDSDLLGDEVKSPDPVEAMVTIEEPVIEVTQMRPDCDPMLSASTNNVGGIGANSRRRKVEMKDVGQNCKKWPFIRFTPMSTTRKKERIQRFNYRAYLGNSAGKCSIRPP